METGVRSSHPPSRDEVLQVGDHGPTFLLRPPHTVESLRADAGHAEANPKPWLCRIKHRQERVGDPHRPDPEEYLWDAAIAMISNGPYDALLRCKRCGAVTTRSHW